MQLIRKANERGQANHGWLNSNHTFSFASYHDPSFMGFGPLRVINDDRVAPGRGFGTHPHRDMEILSYVVEGALEHKDSMGHGSVIRPGDVQLMTAGTGVSHSEYNPSTESSLRFLQIWIIPDKKGLAPGYQQEFFGDARKDRLALVASHDGRDGSLKVHQSVSLFSSELSQAKKVSYELSSGRVLWLQVVTGDLKVGEVILTEGDGLAMTGGSVINITANSDSNFLLFDMKDLTS